MRRYLTENRRRLSQIFGVKRVNAWQELGVTITVPVFVSRGVARTDKVTSTTTTTTRTDLHCEPISNAVFQTAGYVCMEQPALSSAVQCSAVQCNASCRVRCRCGLYEHTDMMSVISVYLCVVTPTG